MAQTRDTVKKPQPSPPPFPQGGFHNEVEIWSEAFRRISPTPPRPVAEDSPPRVHGGLVLAGGQNNWRTPCKNTDSAHRRHHGAASERRARAHSPSARVQALCGGRGKMAGRGGGTSGTSGSGSASCIARESLRWGGQISCFFATDFEIWMAIMTVFSDHFGCWHQLSSLQ